MLNDILSIAAFVGTIILVVGLCALIIIVVAAASMSIFGRDIPYPLKNEEKFFEVMEEYRRDFD